MRQRLQTYAITAITDQRRRIFQRTAIAKLFIDFIYASTLDALPTWPTPA